MNRSGVATLEGMRLPSSLLHLIQPVPLLMGECVKLMATCRVVQPIPTYMYVHLHLYTCMSSLYIHYYCCADVKVNGNAFSPDAEEYCIGTPVSICLTLTNNAGELTCSFFNFCVICV